MSNLYTDDSKDERKTHVQNSIGWKQEGEYYYYMYRADRDRYRQGDELGLRLRNLTRKTVKGACGS